MVLTKKLKNASNPRYMDELNERIANLDGIIKTTKRNVKVKETAMSNENSGLQLEINKIRAEISSEQNKILEIEATMAKNSETMCNSQLNNKRLVRKLKKKQRDIPNYDQSKIDMLKQRKNTLVNEINAERNASSSIVTTLLNQKTALQNQILVTAKNIQNKNM